MNPISPDGSWHVGFIVGIVIAAVIVLVAIAIAVIGFMTDDPFLGAGAVRMRNSQEEMLDRLETELDDAVYRRVCRLLGFDPRDEVGS